MQVFIFHDRDDDTLKAFSTLERAKVFAETLYDGPWINCNSGAAHAEWRIGDYVAITRVEVDGSC